MSQRLRSHTLCYPFPALIGFSGVFRLVCVFGGYNAMRRDALVLKEFKNKKPCGLVIKVVLCHELAQFRKLGSRVCALAYRVLVVLLAYEGRPDKGVHGVTT